MTRRRIDINADMGESYGRWTLGNDAELMPFLTSANIACGYHGGDPHVMRATVRLAREHGVGVGAHVALPDLLGFGRRAMALTPEDLRDYVTYQVGALAAFAAAEGVAVQHVKPHGALYVMCSQDERYARAVVDSLAELDRGLILLLSGGLVADAARAAGVPFVAEGYIDLDYDSAGNLVIERVKRVRDPQETAERAVLLARERCVPTPGGSVPMAADSLCVHGDAPNAVDIARAVRQALLGADVELVPLAELVRRSKEAG
jgi:UPF0271 protein